MIWYRDLVKNNTSLALNSFDQVPGFVSEKGDAHSAGSCSGCSTRPMDVCFNFFWRLNLNDKLDTRDIKASGSHISSNETLKFTILESLQSDFSLILSNVAVHHFDVLLDFISKQKRVCVCFGLSENN